MPNLLTIVIVLTVYAGYAQTVGKPGEQLIRESRRASNEAIAKHDLNAISNYWMDDFVQIRGNGTSLTGKDTIIALWKKTFTANPETSFVRTPSEIIISASDPSMAWETGTWKGINTYSKGGNYSAMWRKLNGIWKIKAELYVSLN